MQYHSHTSLVLSGSGTRKTLAAKTAPMSAAASPVPKPTGSSKQNVHATSHREPHRLYSSSRLRPPRACMWCQYNGRHLKPPALRIMPHRCHNWNCMADRIDSRCKSCQALLGTTTPLPDVTHASQMSHAGVGGNCSLNPAAAKSANSFCTRYNQPAVHPVCCYQVTPRPTAHATGQQPSAPVTVQICKGECTILGFWSMGRVHQQRQSAWGPNQVMQSSLRLPGCCTRCYVQLDSSTAGALLQLYTGTGRTSRNKIARHPARKAAGSTTEPDAAPCTQCNPTASSWLCYQMPEMPWMRASKEASHVYMCR